MKKRVRYVYWQHENMWLGYLEEFPDYWTQGETLEELQENLRDLYNELTGGKIPKTGVCQPVPRHREIKEPLAKHIIKMLEG